MDPEGKIIVVTGAAGSIGGALVRALAERGARSVIAADLDGGGVERLRGQLREQPDGERLAERVHGLWARTQAAGPRP